MKKREKEDNKKLKKYIVNGLTLSRVCATLTMPILFNFLSAPVFLTIIAAILFTDFLDGALARHWGVSTIFGSLADMGADKLFGFSILIVLSTMFPVMIIPLALEILIPIINSKAASHGAVAKSSEIGRIKTFVLGISMCTLLLIGLSPEIIKSLETLKVEIIGKHIYAGTKLFLDNILKHKDIITSIVTTAAITSEAVVTSDYAIKSIKQANKSDKNYKMSEYLKNKEYLKYMKKVLFDEKYYQETKDMSLYEKLTPPEYRENAKVKKLVLDNKKLDK